MRTSLNNKITIFASLFALAGCYNGPEEGCVYIGEKTNLHNEYYVTVSNVDDYDKIEILQSEGETQKSELLATTNHYVGVTLTIEHQKLDKPKEEHKLDLNDFVVKDHTGFKIGNLIVNSKKDGFALSNKDFGTKKPVKDYTWFNQSIESGDKLEFTLYYDFSKEYSSNDTLMILECDFFKTKTGCDIVLGYREVEG